VFLAVKYVVLALALALGVVALALGVVALALALGVVALALGVVALLTSLDVSVDVIRCICELIRRNFMLNFGSHVYLNSGYGLQIGTRVTCAGVCTV